VIAITTWNEIGEVGLCDSGFDAWDDTRLSVDNPATFVLLALSSLLPIPILFVPALVIKLEPMEDYPCAPSEVEMRMWDIGRPRIVILVGLSPVQTA